MTHSRTQSQIKEREAQEQSLCTFKPEIHEVPVTTYDSTNMFAKSLTSFLSGKREKSSEPEPKQFKEKKEAPYELFQTFEPARFVGVLHP